MWGEAQTDDPAVAQEKDGYMYRKVKVRMSTR